MTQTEGMFWRNTVKPQFDNRVGLVKRIESPSTGLGIADTIVNCAGIVSWIELKSKPAFEARLGATALQEKFLKDWITEGGNAYVLAKCGIELFFVWGMDIDKFARKDDYRRRCIEYSDGTAMKDFWNRVVDCLYQDYRS
jgi:hypothetical protein